MILILKPIPLHSSRRDLSGTYMEVEERSYELFYMIFTNLHFSVKCYYGKTLIWGEMEWQDARNRWGYVVHLGII
jgi:hypothetical protein